MKKSKGFAFTTISVEYTFLTCETGRIRLPPTQAVYADRRERLFLEWLKSSCEVGYNLSPTNFVYPVKAASPKDQVDINHVMEIIQEGNTTAALKLGLLGGNSMDNENSETHV
eukprot:gb/GECG01005240.1/.p1 GENE.gb/GECG01005240.1/~~gb/GECG01005240.1/.p1  ORF type:complete len:113 (+),score=12.23 gb/GECG01005240.1/:1-339(+)